jgi:hypothetical protein
VTDAAAASEAVFVALQSMLQVSGRFATVNRHEVKNAPSVQLTAEIWADRIEPYIPANGLAVTSLLHTYKVRIGKGMLTQPEDAIDPAVIGAVVDLMTRLYGDVDLGTTGAELGPFVAEGGGLFAQAGYINRDSKLYRVMDVHIPVIIYDAFPQAR